MIKYIVQVKESTGEILRIFFPQRDTPPQGIDDDGIRTLHVYEDNLPPGCDDLRYFINEHWFVYPWFVHIGKKPNKHARWEPTSSEWVWDTSKVISDIREVRNGKLKQSDWTQLPDSPLTEEQKAEAQAYRQALRDVTIGLAAKNPESHETYPWPEKPIFI